MKHFRPHLASPPPSRLPHVDPLACRALWASVLLTALRDLCKPHPRAPERAAVERWVGTWPGRNFRAVCTRAGLDPRVVHHEMTKIMALPVTERRRHLRRVELPTCTGRGSGPAIPQYGDTSFEPGTPDPAPIDAGARRARVATLFMQGAAPSEMPQIFAASGHAVPVSTVWNDIRQLRASGRIGYRRGPDARATAHIEEESP